MREDDEEFRSSPARFPPCRRRSPAAGRPRAGQSAGGGGAIGSVGFGTGLGAGEPGGGTSGGDGSTGDGEGDGWGGVGIGGDVMARRCPRQRPRTPPRGTAHAEAAIAVMAPDPWPGQTRVARCRATMPPVRSRQATSAQPAPCSRRASAGWSGQARIDSAR